MNVLENSVKSDAGKRPLLSLHFAVKWSILLLALSACTDDRCRRDYRGTWSIIGLTVASGDSVSSPEPMVAPWISLQSNGVVEVPTSSKMLSTECEWTVTCHDTIVEIRIINTESMFDGVYNVWSERGRLFARSHTKERTVELEYTPTILDRMEYR